jgi:hypothetical protein
MSDFMERGRMVNIFAAAAGLWVAAVVLAGAMTRFFTPVLLFALGMPDGRRITRWATYTVCVLLLIAGLQVPYVVFGHKATYSELAGSVTHSCIVTHGSALNVVWGLLSPTWRVTSLASGVLFAPMGLCGAAVCALILQEVLLLKRNKKKAITASEKVDAALRTTISEIPDPGRT